MGEASQKNCLSVSGDRQVADVRPQLLLPLLLAGECIRAQKAILSHPDQSGSADEKLEPDQRLKRSETADRLAVDVVDGRRAARQAGRDVITMRFDRDGRHRLGMFDRALKEEPV